MKDPTIDRTAIAAHLRTARSLLRAGQIDRACGAWWFVQARFGYVSPNLTNKIGSAIQWREAYCWERAS